ncbi:macro domain-containing protein [Actinomadura algeriensis]|uniref:O-acetyl-ADP-ribose deacetylase (Regulator of RNase III) n=1 Tax=Actinomadura algeriensis TaxID=1679523 RepID=A0ABR9K369_9ACTN|nr:macro domain-containing protein [Actinomadura algeriensis]MBE1537048.1 O-acetyl-ADP-ribose deacetylase (regulator of RNase III) [Actinomadura algeriensis]
MAPFREPPGHEAIAAELRLVRRHGLPRLRTLDLPVLAEVLHRAGRDEPTGVPSATELERLIRRATEDLQGDLGAAAGYLFGFVPGTRDWTVGDRRKRAARLYGVSAERFRKHHDPLIVGELAGRLTELSRVPFPGLADDAPTTPRSVRLRGRLGGTMRTVVLHAMPVELVHDVDVIVSPLNTYMELPQSYKTSIAASLRRACARRGPSGELLDDVLARELASWMRDHARPGLPVAPGTVVATGAGELAAVGVRRVYHAAVAVPRPDAAGYQIRPDVVSRAVENVLRLARTDRGAGERPLRSVCLPLFGSGQGGLDPETSFAWLAAALDRALPREEHVSVSFAARSVPVQHAVIKGMTLRG